MTIVAAHGRRGLRMMCMLVALSGISHPIVRAQGAFEVRPSVTVTELHDSNIFSTSVDPQSDFVTRLNPAIDIESRRSSLTWFGRYTFDAERYVAHSDLTDMAARQHGSFGVSYAPTSRLSIAADAELSTSRIPGELFVETGIILPRADAARAAARSSLTRHLDPRTEGTIEYSFREDQVEGGLTARSHSGGVTAERRLTTRSSLTFDYRAEQSVFGSGPEPSTSSVMSHALGLGWTRAMTPRTRLTFTAGPRLTDGQYSPELAAAVDHRRDAAGFALTLQRTQTTMVGVSRPVQVENVAARLVWGRARGPRLRTTCALFRTSVEPLHTYVRSFGVGFEYPIGRTLSADVAFDSHSQSGRLHPAAADASIRRHTTWIRLVATPGAGRSR
jgi:hypothetical protein